MRFVVACTPSITVCYLIFGWRFARDAWNCGCNPGWPITFWQATGLWILIVALGLIVSWDSDE